jgi:uncharacterized membrane protein YphA (DoxX/SURF4 family)
MIPLGISVLRLTLAIIFLLTAWKITKDPKGWSKYIKPWEKKFIMMDPVQFMKFNGGLDFLIGLLLLTPWFTWLIALVAAFHMLTVLVSVGIKGPEYRDTAILGASLALFFLTLPPSIEHVIFP